MYRFSYLDAHQLFARTGFIKEVISSVNTRLKHGCPNDKLL